MKPLPVLLTCAFLAVWATPASAITYGELDGEGHPNVGLLLADWGQDGDHSPLCTGTLVSPTVFVTASHCTAWLPGLGWPVETYVTFASDARVDPPLLSGTAHTNPAYSQAQGDPGDVAVVVLDAPVDIEPAALPGQDHLASRRSRGKLTKRSKFTNVGYGAQEVQHGPGGPTHAQEPVRRVSVSTFRNLQPAWLNLSQNPRHGDGGTCYGDSGGPIFEGTGARTSPGLLVAVTSKGDIPCGNSNVTYRLDTDAARAFLGRFVDLP